MGRLIDEEEAFKVLSAYYKQRTPAQDSALHDALSRVPTAKDKLMCRDCKYWDVSKSNIMNHTCYWGYFLKKEDDYCSWAKPKEEESK